VKWKSVWDFQQIFPSSDFRSLVILRVCGHTRNMKPPAPFNPAWPGGFCPTAKPLRIKSLTLALLLVLAPTLITGCASHRQWRTSLEPCNTANETNTCESAAIEKGSSYVLGFVEFDDQGWLWRRKQLDAVMEALRDEEKNQRLIIVAFVHGWKHSARFDDSNVEMVRENLRFLNLLERLNSKREGRKPRKVVGVYAGWRGLSSKIWGLKELTFWERKNTAHEVGRGGLSELFLRLEDLRNASHIIHEGETNQTRLFIIGHSFGGAATYSALANVLTERAIQTVDLSGHGRPARGVGDMVMLVNPAFEAARYGVLQDIATSQTYLTSNLVNLAVFTSKTDNATKIAFPLGRYVSTLFDSYQSSLERKANHTAIGHFAEYTTHDLLATEVKKASKAVRFREQVDQADALSQRATELKAQARRQTPRQRGPEERVIYHFIGSDLILRRNRDARMPLFNVSVDSRIIPDHNAIDEPEFRRFLAQFLTAFEPQDK
jgi:hypothetical protein